MTFDLRPIRFDQRIAIGMPKPFKAALRRAASEHGVSLGDFCREALNAAIKSEPSAGIDPDFMLMPTSLGRRFKKQDYGR